MSEVDISKALKAAISTGKVEFGVDQTEKAVKNGKAQMIVLSANCPSAELVNNKDVKIHIYSGNNMELGALCGKLLRICSCHHRQGYFQHLNAVRPWPQISC